ncbi:MAG: DUF4919 domain-containing protein, partial [Muribaculaceae bacterium]
MTNLLKYIFLTIILLPVFSTAKEKKINIEKPDMEQIRRDVLDPASKYYYPKLMRQYEQNETIMTLQ